MLLVKRIRQIPLAGLTVIPTSRKFRLPLTLFRQRSYPFFNGSCLHFGASILGWFHLQTEEWIVCGRRRGRVTMRAGNRRSIDRTAKGGRPPDQLRIECTGGKRQ